MAARYAQLRLNRGSSVAMDNVWQVAKVDVRLQYSSRHEVNNAVLISIDLGRHRRWI
jgi:hypothetical protein